MRYAVVACRCGGHRAVDRTAERSTCPRCGRATRLRDAHPLWMGDSPQEAQAAVVAATQALGSPAALAALALPAARAYPRHDSPTDAAAAQGAGIRNKSERAEAVARAYSKLTGSVPHDDLVHALVSSGLDRERAEAEVTRMLATDLLMEPRAGAYRVVGA